MTQLTAQSVATAPEAPTAVPSIRPQSAVSHGVGVAGLVGLLGWLAVARYYGMDGVNSAFASVFFCGVGMVGWSVLVDKVHLNPTTGIDWSRARAAEQDTSEVSSYKLLGLWCTWAIIGFCYVIFRFYWDGSYAIAMGILQWAVLAMVPLSIPYVFWLDRRLIEPRDGAYHFGRWVAGQGDGSDSERDAIFAHLRSWAVKGFFTAFMVSIVPGNFAPLINTPIKHLVGNPVALAQIGIIFLYMLDVHFATVGYVLTMRPLDAHIREANPYGMAWVAALICYPPLVLMNPGGPLAYEPNTAKWDFWFAAYPAILWVWGAALVALTAIYAWATIAFGLRFSNLTHRGIITHGPYAFTRHPAYVSKNLFWWLSTLPFLPTVLTGGTTLDAVRNTVLLAMVSGVYYWRAKTEEQQLLADPEYRAYWEWAQANAWLPRLFKRFNGQDLPLITLKPRHSRDYTR